MLIEMPESERAQLAAATQEAGNGTPAGGNRGGSSVRPEQLNFNYEVSGDAALRPSTIYDDGQFTYIQLRSDQDVPAVFRLIGKEVELVEFVLKGSALVVPRVLEAGMLKLGNSEARFHNKAKEKPSATVNFFKGLFR